MNDPINTFAAVEFSVVRKGYDRDEVDAHMRRVAETHLTLEQQIAGYQQRVQRSEAQVQRSADGSEISHETIARTLVVAQHTAERVVAEAEDEAARLTAEAREQARATAEECDAYLVRLRAEAEADRRRIVGSAADEAKTAATEERDRLAGEVAELAELRDLLQGDVKLLEDHLNEHRTALLDSVSELRDLAERPDSFRMPAPPATSGVKAPVPPATSSDADHADSDHADSGIAGPGLGAGQDAAGAAASAGPAAASSLPAPPATGSDANASTASHADASTPGQGATEATTPDASAPAAAEALTAPRPSDAAEKEVADILSADTLSADAPEASAPMAAEGLFGSEELRSESPTVDAEPLGAAATEALTEPFGLVEPENLGAVTVRPGEPPILPTAEQIAGHAAAAEAADSTEPEARQLPPMVLTAPEVGGGVAADAGFSLEATAPFPVIEVPEELPADAGSGASEDVGSDDDAPAHAADSFLEQLREAVSTPGGDPVDDPLMAFFDQDDDSRDRSWFGRRR